MITIVFAVLISIFLSDVHGRSLPQQQDIVTTIKVKQSKDELLQRQKHNKGLITNGSVDCPSGTIPIVRVNANYSSHGSQSTVMTNSEVPDIVAAIVRTKGDPNKKFLGAAGSPTTYKPNTWIANQWSAARMKLLNGPDTIEVGWMVNPSLFNDNEAHLYVKFKAGQNGCINTLCQGFVHVGQQAPLGLIPDHYSDKGDQYSWTLSIDKHDDGNWWVSIGDDKYEIGYWPKSLFTGLADVANQIEWGGEVSTQRNIDKLPDMGNGKDAIYDTKYSAFFHHITVVNEAHQNVEPDNTEKFQGWDAFYNVLDAGNQGQFGRLIFFGGPAANT